MDDFLYYSSLVCLLIGVIIAYVTEPQGCAGNCEQGRMRCDCRPSE